MHTYIQEEEEIVDNYRNNNGEFSGLVCVMRWQHQTCSCLTPKSNIRCACNVILYTIRCNEVYNILFYTIPSK